MMQHMSDLWQQALADEVRAELGRQDRTAKDAYTALGISSTAWQTYFVQQNREVKSRVLLNLAGFLEMPLSVLLARTEEREKVLKAKAATEIDPIDALAASMNDPDARDAAARAIAESDERRAGGSERHADQ